MKIQKRKILAIAVTIVFLVLIFYKIDVRELLQTFRDFNLKNLWIIVPMYFSTLYLRGIRWKSLLMDNPKYSAYHLGAVFTVGSMLNIFIPARGGDIYRAYYLGENKCESKMKLFGSIILERTLDGIAVFFILLFAVLFYFKQPWILNLAYSIGALFLGSLLIFYVIFKFNKIDWVCNKLAKLLPEKCGNIIQALNKHINSFIEGFEVLNSFKYSTQAFVMNGIIWFIECIVAYLIITSFNITLGFGAALFVLSLISFSTMIPSTSVFLGPYQYAYILALGIYNVDKSTALAISTVHQALLVLMLSVVGVYYLIKFNFSIKEIEKSKQQQ